ncbi:hypothetical protein BGY98DRAFT_938603 [Russula aff. rugulosa BPL654]|nr:hypothetical protein BGY98DRAFT_938603 [Russula aff. rugulosa BPL654]
MWQLFWVSYCLELRMKSLLSTRESPKELDSDELSEQESASKALMRVYGPEFTKETKSEVTVVFTSNLIYKYTKVESEYSKKTCQQSRNVPEGTRGDDASIAKENESNGQELTHACIYLWRESREESVGRGLATAERHQMLFQWAETEHGHTVTYNKPKSGWPPTSKHGQSSIQKHWSDL